MENKVPRTVAETVAFNIRKYRKHVGMTQEELASAIGTTKSAISKYELGHRFPDADTMEALANAFKISALFLIADENTANEALKALEERDYAMKDYVARRFKEAHAWKESKDRLNTAFDLLNPSGQNEAVKRVEELTEIPRYRTETAPQTPPAAQEGKDTTPPPDGAEGPQEGE